MLRIIQNRSSASAETYYSKADYYSEGQELAGRWGGKGAARLGLAGNIEQAQFKSLCENRNPQTGKRLTPRTKDDRTVGYDFNFHVPKGVSLAYMLNQDERILDAFRDSVDETMREIEADTKTRVRTRGRDEERTTGNLAWGQFIHLTARPVEGVPDPHLHAHCFVFNNTFDEKEQRWKAAQFRDIKRDAPYFQAAFYARFAKRLQELGYPIARQGRDWDLAGVPKAISRKFSRRTQQVEEAAADKGVSRATEKDKLGAKTRERKQSELTMPELRKLWRERLTSDEQATLGALSVTTPLPTTAPQAAKRAVAHAISHCFEREAVIAQRKLAAEALLHTLGETLPGDLEGEMLKQGVLTRDLAGRTMATTRNVLAEEQAMVAFARRGRVQAKPLNREWKLKRTWLNEGQQSAVRHVLQSADRVMMIKGMAGTGKTSLMQEAVDAIEVGGHQVFTFAPSAEASRNVLRSEGFASATTVAELLANETLQRSLAGQVIWIDEAGLLGTRQLKQVFDIAATQNARIILSGDWKQHSAVERGAAMRLLHQVGGIMPVEVSDIKRQAGQYREAVAHLARGETEAGFDQLDELGWVQEVSDTERPKAIAQEYVRSLASDGEAPLVVSPTHAEGEQITQAIRAELRAQGRLAKEERHLLRLTPRNLTAAERADPAMYEPGDMVVFHQNAPGHTKGERLLLGDSPPTELCKLAKRFQVYAASASSFAAGDRVRFTSNAMTKDGKHRLNNGAMHTIKGFTEQGDLRLDNGWIVAASHGFIAPGYVVTSHASQGKTVNKVIVAESSASFAAASREQFYVSVSRGKKQAMIFTDDKQLLKESVAETAPRLAALELLAGVEPASPKVRRLVAHARANEVDTPAHTHPVTELTHGTR